MSNRRENQELSCPRITPTTHFPTAASSGGQGLRDISTGTTIWPCLDVAKSPTVRANQAVLKTTPSHPSSSNTDLTNLQLLLPRDQCLALTPPS